MTDNMADHVKLETPKQTVIITVKEFPVKLAFGEKEYILRVTKNGKLILN